MTGNKYNGIILMPRDFRLLKAIAVGRVVDSEKVQVIAGFGSTRRANDRLSRLTRAGLLRRFFVGTQAGGRKALYGLSSKGAGAAGEHGYRPIQRQKDELVVGDRFVEHQLALNSIWIKVQFQSLPEGYRLVRWISFRVPLCASVPLVPDGYFEVNGPYGMLPMFCEVDRGSEPLKTWKKKTELYLKLAISGEFEKLFGQSRFRVLVITFSERRLRNIRRTVAKQTDKIFWFSTFDNINREGLWSSIWLRPSGDSELSLV